MVSSSSSSTPELPNRTPEEPATRVPEGPSGRVPEQTPATVPNRMTIIDDQRFLLLFIMGTYFGPDVEAERPRKYVFQRMIEQRPQYTRRDLAGSGMSTSRIESVYYYIVRMAQETVVAKLSMLHQFLRGCLVSPSPAFVSDLRQFPDLFPPHLHHYIRFGLLQNVIQDIIFISNPDMSYIRPEDVNRFKRLTNREFLFLDGDAAMSYRGDRIGGIPDNVAAQRNNQDLPESSSRGSRRRQAYHMESGEPVPIPAPLYSAAPHRNVTRSSMQYNSRPVDFFAPMSFTLHGVPEIAPRTMAADGHLRSVIGTIDVHIRDDGYIFCVSLPIRIHGRNELTCIVHDDGEITIKGVAITSSGMVIDDRQPADLHLHYYCLPNEFSISFRLPGPVDPQQFTGGTRSDGIFEGRVRRIVRL